MQRVPPSAGILERELEGLKFSECLPMRLGLDVLSRRRADPDAVGVALLEPRDVVDDRGRVRP